GKCLGSSGDPPSDGDDGNGNGKDDGEEEDEDKDMSVSGAGDRLVKRCNHHWGGSGPGDEGKTGIGDKHNPDGPGAPNGGKGGHKSCKE
ncbi:hypothetical protein FRC11_014584, partial [Ceratobasidium sp. 423]